MVGLDPIADRARFVHKIGVQFQDIGIPLRMKAREALGAVLRPLSDVY